MSIGNFVRHSMTGHQGRIIALANGLVHVLIRDRGIVIEDRMENFNPSPEAA